MMSDLEKAHSYRGPSSWPRVVKCPASEKMSRGAPNTPNYAAAEGTVFHYLVEECLGRGIEAADFLKQNEDQSMTVDGFQVPYDSDMVSYATPGLNWLRDNFIEVDGWEVFIEARVDISPWAGEGQFGTSDVVAYNIEEKKVLIFDWKYGRVPVHAHENRQLLGYALGSWQTLLRTAFALEDPSEVTVQLVIYQPRVASGMDIWETDYGRLLDYGDDVIAAFEKADSEFPPFNPGESQCKYCAHRNKCPALFGLALGLMDDGLEVPERMDAIADKRIGEILKNISLVRSVLDQVEKTAHERALAGRAPDGFKLVYGRRPPRQFIKNDETRDKVVDILGEAAYTEPKLITPTQAEKILGKANFAEALSDTVEQAKSPLKLVENADKRAAFVPMVELFDDVVDP